MIALIVGRFAEFVNHQRIGHVGGVAHAQVNDVDAGAALAVLQIVNPAEQIRRQPLDAVCHVDLKRPRRRIRFTLHESSVVYVRKIVLVLLASLTFFWRFLQ